MRFVHLLQVRLQGSSRYNAPKHDRSGFGRTIAGAVSLGEDSVDLRMVADLGIPSSLADPHRNDDRLGKKKVPTPSRSSTVAPITTVLEFREEFCRSSQKSRVMSDRKR